MPGAAAQRSTWGTAGPGGKDPLQKEQTAYEILGVSRGATDADVLAAFAARLRSGVSIQKLTAAKRVLQSPSERALVDLFHYLPEWGGDLSPNAVQQAAVLDPARRGSTAQAWENRLRSGFPDLGAAHSLAVLWYWWALHEEDQNGGVKKAASAMPTDQMWRKAIACWSMVLSSEEFWSGTGGIGSEVVPQVSTAIVDRLTGRLHELAQRHRGNNSAGLVARYQELELALKTELRTAKQVGAAGIRTGRGKVVCGVLMLQQVELLDTVRQQVAAGLKRSPSSENLKKLGNALSRFASIAALIEANRPQSALEAIYELPRKEQETPEVKVLRARALHALAQQQAGLNNSSEALGAWETALKLQPASELRAAILSELVSYCKTRATALRRQPEEAIALLERGVKLSDDRDLKLLLAELLTNRGIQEINDAQGKTRPVEIERAFGRGLADLDEAKRLGSKRAADQLETARRLYEDFTSGSILREAHKAAERQDWDSAINFLKEALPNVSGDAADVVRKNLAVCLCNRAMAKANDALKKPNPALTKLDSLFKQISGGIYANYGCAICSNPDAWHQLNLPSGGTARLCERCAGMIQSTLAETSRPDPTTVSALRSAKGDLEEAILLDPSNQHARKNLEDVRNIIAQVEAGVSFRPTGTNQSSTTYRNKSFSMWLSFKSNLAEVIPNPVYMVFLAVAGNAFFSKDGSVWSGLIWLAVWLVVVLGVAGLRMIIDYRDS